MKTFWIARYNDTTYFVVDDKITTSLWEDQIDGDGLVAIEWIGQALGATVKRAWIDELIQKRLGDEPDNEADELEKWIAEETADVLFANYQDPLA